MTLLEIIEEQALFGFTGRINIAAKNNGQHIGQISQKDGVVVNANFESKSGQKALFQALATVHQSPDQFNMIVEPEVVDDSVVQFNFPFEKIYVEFGKLRAKYTEALKYRPPQHVRLAVNADFIQNGEDVSAEEFELLKLMTIYSKVSEIYLKSSLSDWELTALLITLRKKKAIKVIAN